MVGLRQGTHGGGAGGRAAGNFDFMPSQNFNYGSPTNPLQALMSQRQQGGGGIQFPSGPQVGSSQQSFFGPGGPQAPDFSGGGGMQQPDYGGLSDMPGYGSPSMPEWTGNTGPTHIGAGDVRIDYEAQNPLKMKGMDLFGQLSGQALQAYLGQMGERGNMNRAILQNMLGFGGLDVQRQLGMGNIGANVFGTQAGLYGQMQGYEQSQREALMRQQLGMAGLTEQGRATDLQHKLGMRGIEAPQEQRMETLKYLMGMPGLSGLTGGGGGASSSPTTAPTSMLGMGGATGPFEDAFARRQGAASAGNAAGIEQARQGMLERATGPGGGQAGAAGINPLMAHSRAMADTQSSANLRQQMLGERQLSSSLLGALGGLV